MRGIEGEQVLLRLILSESRYRDRQPVVQIIVELLRREGLAGATVVRGIAGFGHDRAIHTVDVEVASIGLPIVIEVVDSQERIDRVLPQLGPLMEGGVMMRERARVIRYTVTDSSRSEGRGPSPA